MRAIQLQGPHAVQLVDVPPEAPAPGTVTVRIGAVGLCGTDYAAVDGTLGLNRLPVILGHEAAGTVVASTDPSRPVGAVVAFDPLVSCGECAACRSGHPEWCSAVGVLGVMQDGAARDVAMFSAAHWVVCPPGTPVTDAALVEPVHVALTVLAAADGPPPGPVLLLGTGALGLLLLHLLRVRDPARVVFAADTVPTRQAQAVARGARPWSPDAGPVPTVLDGVGSAESLASAVQAVAPGGRIVVYGVPKPGTAVPDAATAFRKNVRLRFSRLYSHDFGPAVATVAAGQVTAADVVSDELTPEDAVAFLNTRGWTAPSRWGKVMVRWA